MAIESNIWIFAVFGFAYKYLNHPSRALNYLSQAQRVPQHYIASYLGISAETLSRIKKRVVHKLQNDIQDNYQSLAYAI